MDQQQPLEHHRDKRIPAATPGVPIHDLLKKRGSLGWFSAFLWGDPSGLGVVMMLGRG